MITKNKAQHGNALFFVLIGVALFAALSFTVANGLRSQTTSKLSSRQLEIAASELRSYAKKIELGIDRLRRRGVSEKDICAYNSNFSYTAYKNNNNTNPACSDDSNNIYHISGGKVRWQIMPQEWFHSSADGAFSENFLLCTSTEIVKAGKTKSGYGGDKTTQDAIAIIGPIDLELCEILNKKIGYEDPTPAGTYGTTINNACKRYFGSNIFSIDSSNEIGAGLERCIKDPALEGYYYYYTVLVR